MIQIESYQDYEFPFVLRPVLDKPEPSQYEASVLDQPLRFEYFEKNCSKKRIVGKRQWAVYPLDDFWDRDIAGFKCAHAGPFNVYALGYRLRGSGGCHALELKIKKPDLAGLDGRKGMLSVRVEALYAGGKALYEHNEHNEKFQPVDFGSSKFDLIVYVPESDDKPDQAKLTAVIRLPEKIEKIVVPRFTVGQKLEINRVRFVVDEFSNGSYRLSTDEKLPMIKDIKAITEDDEEPRYVGHSIDRSRGHIRVSPLGPDELYCFYICEAEDERRYDLQLQIP